MTVQRYNVSNKLEKSDRLYCIYILSENVNEMLVVKNVEREPIRIKKSLTNPPKQGILCTNDMSTHCNYEPLLLILQFCGHWHCVLDVTTLEFIYTRIRLYMYFKNICISSSYKYMYWVNNLQKKKTIIVKWAIEYLVSWKERHNILHFVIFFSYIKICKCRARGTSVISDMARYINVFGLDRSVLHINRLIPTTSRQFRRTKILNTILLLMQSTLQKMHMLLVTV